MTGRRHQPARPPYAACLGAGRGWTFWAYSSRLGGIKPDRAPSTSSASAFYAPELDRGGAGSSRFGFDAVVVAIRLLGAIGSRSSNGMSSS